MAQYLGSPWFQVGVIPVILMIIGVLANRLGRRDGDDTPRRNDWAVGTTMLLMVLGAIVGDVQGLKSKPAESLAWLLGVLFASFLSLDHDRFRSWERDAAGLPTKTKRWFVGIVWPDFLCLLIFAFFQYQKLTP